jgi:ribokinase
MTGKPSVVAIGAAVQDVFLEGNLFKPRNNGNGLVEEFKLGTKNEVDNVTYSTGGGATNASVTFARLGLHSSYMGRVGDDIAGRAVMEELHKDGVDTSLVKKSSDKGTGYSLILLSPSGERTILTYRGASQQYDIKNSDFHSIKPDWFYISSLSGDFESLQAIVEYAQDHGIKIAINPGEKEIKHHQEFKKLMPSFNILSVNKEEMEQLYGTADLHTLLKKANEQIEIVVVTDGAKGSYVADRQNIYKAGMYEDVPVIDRAGAGDAFCSGFVAQITLGESIKHAITYGSANSTSVVSKIGAKTGILKAGVSLHAMPIEVSNL